MLSATLLYDNNKHLLGKRLHSLCCISCCQSVSQCFCLFSRLLFFRRIRLHFNNNGTHLQLIHRWHYWCCVKTLLHVFFTYLVLYSWVKLTTLMWSPLFRPSLSQAVTACWLDLEDNHPKIMTRRWSLWWPAEPLPAAAQHGVAPCPCLSSFCACTCLDAVCFCVNVCRRGCGGVPRNTDMIQNKCRTGVLHICASVGATWMTKCGLRQNLKLWMRVYARVCCAYTCGGICMSPRRVFIFVFSTRGRENDLSPVIISWLTRSDVVIVKSI